MTTEVATRNGDAAIIEQVIMHGDLKDLTPAQRVTYYRRVCDSLNLNPFTRPFDYLILNNKMVLYARKEATDQIRAIQGVSIQIVSREKIEDVYVVTARATLPSGRTDESTGAVSVAGLKAEFLANAYMKAETKSKRRVTLSICGLGMLDETEVESIPGAERVVVAETGEIVTPSKPDKPATIASQLSPELARNEFRDQGDLMTWAKKMFGVSVNELLMAVHVTAANQIKDLSDAANIFRGTFRPLGAPEPASTEGIFEEAG